MSREIVEDLNQNAVMGILTKWRFVGRFTATRGEHTEAKVGVMWPQTKELGHPPKAGRSGVQVLPYSLRESVPRADNLDF